MNQQWLLFVADGQVVLVPVWESSGSEAVLNVAVHSLVVVFEEYALASRVGEAAPGVLVPCNIIHPIGPVVVASQHNTTYQLFCGFFLEPMLMVGIEVIAECGAGQRRGLGQGRGEVWGRAEERFGAAQRRGLGQGRGEVWGGAEERFGAGQRRGLGRGRGEVWGGAEERCGAGQRRGLGRGRGGVRYTAEAG